MRQHVYICLIIILSSGKVFSQDNNFFKKTFIEAEYFFYNEEYQEAINLYSELLKIDPDNANVNFLIAACYLSLYGHKEKAIPHLEKAVVDMTPGYREGSYKERSAPREAIFALAKTYHVKEEFDKAIEQYEKYRSVMIKKRFADVEFVNHQIKSSELGKSMIKRPVDVQFLNLGEQVNKYKSNYNPVVSWDDSTMIYVTDRSQYKAIIMIRRLPGGGWSEPREINEEVGSDGDSYPTSLSSNGSELYLIKKDAYGSDVYISYMKNGGFTTMVPLNKFINTDYSETHACVSFNGKALYFTSDRPGGQGALDIWVSEITEEGDWGAPRNLGPKINSPYSEETPFLAERGKKLYFSSQGHATMGGFDFFEAVKIPTMKIGFATETGKSKRGTAIQDDAGWSFPENLGYPINTADDDLFYNPRKNGQGAYYSALSEDIESFRSIYMVRLVGDEPTIAAIRKGDRLNVESSDIQTVSTTVQGSAETTDTSGTETGEGGVADAGRTEVEGGTEAEGGTEVITPGDDYYVLNSVLFGFDSDVLDTDAAEEADRVLKVMKRHPEVRLQLTGHTDDVGADEYNLQLSQRRAQSVANYLIGKGIDASRIKVTAAGETKPIAINRYEDGSDSPDGRKLNRHVSIKLGNMQNTNVRVNNLLVPDHLKPKFEQSYSVLLINSEVMIDTIPDVVAGEQTALIITDSAFLYTAGGFNHKLEAVKYLNEVLDAGYPDAGMMEQSDLEDLIARLSTEGIDVTAGYTIQFIALRNAVAAEQFDQLKGAVEYAGQDGLHRYVYGDYQSIQEAREMLPRIKKMGFHDAFIMSILRYKRLAE